MKEYLYTSQGVNYPKTDTLIRSAVFFCASITLEDVDIKTNNRTKRTENRQMCIHIYTRTPLCKHTGRRNFYYMLSVLSPLLLSNHILATFDDRYNYQYDNKYCTTRNYEI